MNITIPEIDIDQYKITMNISAEEYATKKANEFRSSFFSNSQSGSKTDPKSGNRNLSSEELSDASNHAAKSG